MKTLKRNSLLVALLAGTTLLAVGCNQSPPGETVGQKLDRAADKVATATSEAADKVASTTAATAEKIGSTTSVNADKTAVVFDDATITAKVKAAILAEPGLRSLQIVVDTKDAVVTLTGTVATGPLKDRAEAIAANIDGVRLVRDLLITKSA